MPHKIGKVMNGAEFEKAQAVLRDNPGQYTWARCRQCNDPATHFVQEDKDEFVLYCDKHAPDYAESLNPKEAVPGGRAMPSHPAALIEAFLPDNLPDTVSRLSGPGLAKLRSRLSSQFGIRLRSTGDRPNLAQTNIVMQTLDVSPENPCLVEFDQFILDPFTGPGRLDLVERDSSDDVEFDFEGNLLSGGESEVTIATKSGFEDGDTVGNWSRLKRVITSDKVYSIVFVPGTAGDGIFSISARSLIPIDPDQTPLPS